MIDNGWLMMDNWQWTKVFCMQVTQKEQHWTSRSCRIKILLVHASRISTCFLKLIMWQVGALLFSSDRRLLQNMKTSVLEEFNILQTDVFKICCNMRLSPEENERVQTYVPQKFSKIWVLHQLSVYKQARCVRTECPILNHQQAEHLQLMIEDHSKLHNCLELAWTNWSKTD